MSVSDVEFMRARRLLTTIADKYHATIVRSYDRCGDQMGSLLNSLS